MLCEATFQRPGTADTSTLWGAFLWRAVLWRVILLGGHTTGSRTMEAPTVEDCTVPCRWSSGLLNIYPLAAEGRQPPVWSLKPSADMPNTFLDITFGCKMMFVPPAPLHDYEALRARCSQPPAGANHRVPPGVSGPLQLITPWPRASETELSLAQGPGHICFPLHLAVSPCFGGVYVGGTTKSLSFQKWILME